MWVLIIELAALAIKVGFGLLCLWIKFTFGFIKYEFKLIRKSFKDYPFGFFSFFLHLIGFWVGIGSAYPYGTNWLLKFYSFGLADSLTEMADFIWWPILTILKPLGNLSYENALVIILFIVISLGLFLVWPIGTICLFEWIFFFVPLLHAVLTQLILGLIFRPYLLKWRQWRTDRFYEKVHKRSQADPEVRAIGDLSRSIRAMWDAKDDAETARQRADGIGTGIMEVELPNYGPAKKAIRDFNETYNRAYEKVTDMSMYCYQAIDFLREQYGENGKAERMYSDMLEKHYDLVDCFKETFDLVCYSEDATGIPKAYEEFKRNILMVKNAQEEFVKTLEELYGKTLIQAIFKKLKEE